MNIYVISTYGTYIIVNNTMNSMSEHILLIVVDCTQYSRTMQKSRILWHNFNDGRACCGAVQGWVMALKSAPSSDWTHNMNRIPLERQIRSCLRHLALTTPCSCPLLMSCFGWYDLSVFEFGWLMMTDEIIFRESSTCFIRLMTSLFVSRLQKTSKKALNGFGIRWYNHYYQITVAPLREWEGRSASYSSTSNALAIKVNI